jgi:pimeloyl-ACP methyl ester carboxylesterase
MTMPSLVYVGELDTFWREGLERCADQIPNATFVVLPGLDHQEALERGDVVLPHVRQFLSSAAK